MRDRFINTPAAYALGMFAMMVPSQAFLSYFNYYYVEKLGLGLALATIARTIYLFWDAVNNPMAGYLSDRTKTRFGRRRPWIMGSIPVFMLVFIMVFSVPRGLEDTGLFVWLVLSIVLFEGVATLLWVNYGALFPELFQGERLRAKASAVQQIYQIVALLIGTSLTPIIYGAIGFGWMSVSYSLLFGVCMIGFVLSIREREDIPQAAPMPMLEAFRVTLKNKPFWTFNIANSFAQTVNGLLGALMPFYAKYALHISERYVSVLMAAVFVSVIPLVAAWYYISRKLGGLSSWRLAFAVYGLAAVPLWFANNLGEGIVAGIIAGFGMAGFLVTPALLSSRIIDLDAERTGHRREGIYTAVAGFITRSSGLIAALAFWIVGLLYGYESGDKPGPHPETVFRVLISAVPFILLAVSFVVSLFVKLSEKRISGEEEGSVGE
ncbi:GPH family glycoside/pentoside/hexuronide:cation symporter [Paenibacillus cellulosilyticus]|uniref:GPH family glycoside/pentoside/hexuronide:cation symporter n=1 Tax=Paenibacillus cellulosilyticus TaxID=375489 RepID=A0A2V2YUS8_9BACL|nr:MFS transporter [Paenibacillus cellulosilyticus]PWW02772.1 GPH family glycoside/pentoside/hexuronide:cation symporter [Paenibacillus cellulosilyticus]QKS45695.1 MFS transporter [Paenibacillus cellulosilyticus]